MSDITTLNVNIYEHVVFATRHYETCSFQSKCHKVLTIISCQTCQSAFLFVKHYSLFAPQSSTELVARCWEKLFALDIFPWAVLFTICHKTQRMLSLL